LAYKMRIPAKWYEGNPNLKNWGYDFLYNVDASVGIDGVNMPGDVFLIQYMLYRWGHYNVEWAAPGLQSGESPDFAVPKIEINGTFDPLTRAWIIYFQMYRYNYTKTLNGRIEPLLSQLGPHVTATLLDLNIQVRAAAPTLADNDFSFAQAPAPVKQAVKELRG
jgi:hypothetical protein